ncbi:CPBP family intramembrane metalloprotease [Candidatus Saccharibacteria bacterium]|nr:CPBP family intramembrane metalloprotease [Candidatus Saccharibacteria bacterium]
MPKKSNPVWWRIVLTVIGLLVWVGVSIIASQLIIGYLMIWILGSDNFSQPVSMAVYSALSYLFAMVLIIAIPPILKSKQKNNKEKQALKNDKKESFRESLGLRDWPTWTDVGLAPAGFIAYLLLAWLFTTLFTIFPWFNVAEAQDVGFNYYLTGIDRFIAFTVLVVVAPIAEEIIFRGWLYDKLRGKLLEKYSNIVSIIVSCFLTSLLFGIIHLQWNVGVNVFAMSLVLCVMREITGTIYAGILLHMIKNGLAFYLLYVLGIR